MNNTVISPTDVFVTVESENFWWGMYGFDRILWEDITIHLRRKGKEVHAATTITTKGYLKEIIRTEGPESPELETMNYGMTIDDLLSAKSLKFGYYYDDQDDTGFYEVEFVAKRNPQGAKPSLITIYHPAEEITGQVVRECVSRYCREFLRVPFSKVYLVGKPKKSASRKSYREWVKEWKEHEKYIKSGGKFEVHLLPHALEQIFGTEEVERFSGEIDYGFLKEGQYHVKLKDGTERLIGPPNMDLFEK